MSFVTNKLKGFWLGKKIKLTTMRFFKSSHFAFSQFKKSFRVRTATFLTLGLLTFLITVAVSWLTGNQIVSQFFSNLHFWQQHQPAWLEVPVVSELAALIPTIILFLIVQIVIKLSPQPRVWSRVIVISILLALTVRYTLWRSFSTLNLETPLNGIFSLTLFGLELLAIFAASIQLFLTLGVKSRHHESEQLEQQVKQGNYTPTVDILIPTYNEPVFILKRTIIGCQALDYPHKTVYLLDDTRRPEVQKLAQSLGCEYITRPDNQDAKAGNLNHAIFQKTQGELIVVFDADFVPTQNFLTRTVGFFQNPQIALVQSHQYFYNFDPTARNLGLENIVTHEPEEFSRRTQPIRDGANSTLCYGSSFVVRRDPLEKIGGFYTESLSEDYFTGICLSALGYQVIYLDEKLSAGLAADNMAEHIAQRLRWARGTIQAFFIKANPLTIPGLNLRQRLAHLEGLLLWFTNFSRIAFLTIPLTYTFFGIIPVQTPMLEWIYFFLPYYWVHLSVYSWLSLRSRSALISDIYSVAQCFPVALTVLHTLLSPFSKGFRVTAKGVSNTQFRFNWRLAFPLILIWVATAISFLKLLGFLEIEWFQPAVAHSFEFWGLGLFWNSYNLLVLSVAILSLIDVPKADPYDWFHLQKIVKLEQAGNVCWGITKMISEGGIILTFNQFPAFLKTQKSVSLHLVEENLQLFGEITDFQQSKTVHQAEIMFKNVNLEQHRHLIQLLFCRPGQWKHHEAPGEFQSLGLLMRILLRPKLLFDRQPTRKAMDVS